MLNCNTHCGVVSSFHPCRYYSSKYPYPGVPLGPRHSFTWIPVKDRTVGNRPVMLTFSGTVAQPDELAMQSAVLDRQWSVMTHLVTYGSDKQMLRDLDMTDYRTSLLRSSFSLCPAAKSHDTYIFWEAIEAGSIPIIVWHGKQHEDVGNGRRCPDSFQDILNTQPPIVMLKSWDKLADFIELVTEAEIAEQRRRLVEWGETFWKNIAAKADAMIRSGRSNPSGLASKPINNSAHPTNSKTAESAGV